MKSFSSRLVLGLAALSFSFGAFAAPKLVANRSVAYLGTALDNSFIGSTTSPGISALFTLGDSAAIQTYLGIHGINPFQMGGGIQFKHSVVGDNMKGFHIGGGVGLGANGGLTRTFYVNIVPNMGVHFEIVDRVLLSVETSLTFNIRTSGTSNLELTLGGNSPLLGASVLFGL